MVDRDPYDGQPYYCAICGMGFAEMLACEYPACVLESAADAQRRQQRRRHVQTAGAFGSREATPSGEGTDADR